MVEGKKDGAGVFYDAKTEDLIFAYWLDDMPWSNVRVFSSDRSYTLIPECESWLTGEGKRYYFQS